jgi:hypothetical protein
MNTHNTITSTITPLLKAAKLDHLNYKKVSELCDYYLNVQYKNTYPRERSSVFEEIVHIIRDFPEKLRDARIDLCFYMILAEHSNYKSESFKFGSSAFRGGEEPCTYPGSPDFEMWQELLATISKLETK